MAGPFSGSRERCVQASVGAVIERVRDMDNETDERGPIPFDELMDVLRNRAKFGDRYSAAAVREIERAAAARTCRDAPHFIGGVNAQA
jgi:hypothetical protein